MVEFVVKVTYIILKFELKWREWIKAKSIEMKHFGIWICINMHYGVNISY